MLCDSRIARYTRSSLGGRAVHPLSIRAISRSEDIRVVEPGRGVARLVLVVLHLVRGRARARDTVRVRCRVGLGLGLGLGLGRGLGASPPAWPSGAPRRALGRPRATRRQPCPRARANRARRREVGPGKPAHWHGARRRRPACRCPAWRGSTELGLRFQQSRGTYRQIRCTGRCISVSYY